MAETQSPSRQEMIDRLRDLAERLGKRAVSRAEFTRETGIIEYHVQKHFDSWNEFVESAGLDPYVANRRAEDDELMAAMHDAFVKGEGVLTRARFRRQGGYSDDVYAKRFGGWPGALLAFRAWAEANAPDFPYLADLPADGETRRAGLAVADEEGRTVVWQPTGRTQYGPFLNFRGLQHAPINEQGVVYLFGMIAFDLGYVVEGIGTGFPDCEAKRAVGGDTWERVRIEFEYRSRNFHVHGHDPAGCDVLVCWEDNWPECPVEVVELKSAVNLLGD